MENVANTMKLMDNNDIEKENNELSFIGRDIGLINQDLLNKVEIEGALRCDDHFVELERLLYDP